MKLGKEIFRTKPTGNQYVLMTAIGIVVAGLIAATIFVIAPEVSDPRNGKLLQRLFVPGIILGGGFVAISLLVQAIIETRRGQVIFYRNGLELVKPDGVYEYSYSELTDVRLTRKDPDKDSASISLGLAVLLGNPARAGMAAAQLQQHLGVTFRIDGESTRSVLIPDFRSYVTLDEQFAVHCAGYSRVTN